MYIDHTFGLYTILTAAEWAGVDQAEHWPRQWQEGAKGYAERFGSVMGIYAVHGTAQYALGEAFHEDLRYLHCPGCSASGKIKTAFLNTFAARRGKDGYEDISATRLLAPIPASLVASTWLPGKYNPKVIGRVIVFNYTFSLTKNLFMAFIGR